MPLHLEAPQYILQLVGQRQRQRMSLHLGGTAIHLAIGRVQMQAVKESIIQRRKNLPSKISVLAGKQSNKRCRRIFNLPRSTLRDGEKSGICCSQIGNNIGVEFCNNANQQKGRSSSGNMILVELEKQPNRSPTLVSLKTIQNAINKII